MTNGISSRDNNVTNRSAVVNSPERSITEEESPTSKDISLSDKLTASTATDTAARLEALVNERAALREEVAQLRRSLEQIQGKHEEELGSIRERLADTQGEKEQAETQYRNLLGKVNTIRSQLGERLKADAVGGHLPPPLRCSWKYRKIYRRHGVGLKTLRSNAAIYVNKMRRVLESWQ